MEHSVTRDELVRALSRASVTIYDTDGLHGVAGKEPGSHPIQANGHVKFPSEVADGLMSTIELERSTRAAEIARCRAEGARCDREGGPCTCPCDPETEAAASRTSRVLLFEQEADPELSAMTRMHAELDDLDLCARSRVLAYLADRLGVDL